MNAIIFGATGQDGYYLGRLLKEQQVTTIEVARTGSGNNGSVADHGFVNGLIREHKPDYIFHFAANSTTRYDVLFENHESISTGTFNILDAVKLHSPHTRVFLSGSGLQFLNTGKPINEQTPFDAPNPYSVSRIQSVYAARYYRTLNLKVYMGYFFNHESPRRTERHVSKMIAEAVKRIAVNNEEVISIGDISTRKEWTFAGDVVQAIWMLVNQDAVFEAVIGSGNGYSIEDWLKACFGLIGKDWKNHVQGKDGFKAEYQALISDPALIKSLGWNPQTDLEGLARMMVLDAKG
jgi:GDPmannose 4,6-dehydratase